jgi:RNA polymerase sigma factor (sigma-70 family)
MSAAAVRSLVRAARPDEAALLAAVAVGDEPAFAELVRRHGPMTLGVCRRVLGPTADADDAFQVTFLALAKHAKSVRTPAALPGWLHRTALRAAQKIKARTPRPAEAAEPAVQPDPLADLSWKEVRAVLDAELNALPDRLRGPLVLCYLDGRTRDDAAAALGVSLSTLKRRIADGLDRLNTRLTRRGVAGAGLAAAALTGHGLTAAVPTALTRKAATAFGTLPATGFVSILAGWKAAVSAVALLVGLTAAGALVSAQPQPVTAPPAKEEKADKADTPGFDRLSDPLPDGALARLGTSRLRGRRLTFSPDSRRVVRETAGGDLQLYEVPSGKFLAKLRAADVPERESIVGSTIAFSPDSKLLAAVLWEGRAGIWNTDTGKLVRWIDSGRFYSIVRCDFTPDGKLIAIGGAEDNRNDEKIAVSVYEVATGKKLFTEVGASSRFTADGKHILVWNGYRHGGERGNNVRVVSTGDPGERWQLPLDTHVPNSDDPRSDGKEVLFELQKNGTVLLRDWKSGEVKHTLEGAVRGDRGGMNLRHAPGRRELIVTQAEPPTLWGWNLDDGKLIWKREVPAPPYWADLSNDGTTVVTSGKAGEVLTIDAATGNDKAVIPVKAVGHSNSQMEPSSDGKVVATFTASPEPGGGTVLFWDAATGKKLTDLPGHAALIHDATFTPDGAKILTAGRDNTLRTWDAATGRELAKVELVAPAQMALSPDGKRLYAADATGTIRVVDPATGRVQATFAAFKKQLLNMTLTADGKQLIVAGRDADEPGRVRFLTAASGEQVREFDTGDLRLEQMAASADGSVVVTTGEGRKLAVWSADGKAVADHAGVGKREPSWKDRPPFYLIGSAAVSADGKRVTFSDQEAGVGVIDGPTQKVLGRAVLKDVFYQNGAARYDVRDVLAVSPDGKTVAWSGVESTADVYLIELRTQSVRRKLPGDSYPVKRLAFSPDGSKLLSTGPDGAALVWDVFDRHAKKPTDKPDAKTVAGWWDALGAEDAATADRALRAMAAHPTEAVKLLSGKLPEKAVEPAAIDKLIGQLGDRDFATREAATKALAEVGAALDKLEAAAEKSESAEVRERAERLLGRLRRVGPLRAERAVEALERIGSTDARKVLEALAGGSPDAKAALGRMTASGR